MGMPTAVNVLKRYLVIMAYVDVRRNIALNAWVGVHQPCSSNVRALFVDAVRHILLHLGKTMLELVGNEKTREASPDGNNTQWSWLHREFVEEGHLMAQGVLRLLDRSIDVWSLDSFCTLASDDFV
jgi:hypothetical protein